MKRDFQIRRLLKETRAINAFRKKRAYASIVAKTTSLLDAYPYFVPVLVLKAQAIQLVDKDVGSSGLEEAKRVLRLAVELDPKSLDALNELAHFLFAVEDRSDEAVKLFERSIAMGLQTLREAYVGVIRCLMELDRWRSCEKALGEAGRIWARDLEIAALAQEFHEMRPTKRRKA